MTKNPQVLLAGRYQMVPRTLILVFNGDQVLLQKGSPDKKIYPGYFNGLGGHIERGEDVLSAARRELMEEAGIECPDLHLYGTVAIDVEKTNGILLFVMAGHQIKGQINDSEEGSLHWINVNELSQHKVVEDIPEIVERIRKIGQTQAVFHALYTYSEEGKRTTTIGS